MSWERPERTDLTFALSQAVSGLWEASFERAFRRRLLVRFRRADAGLLGARDTVHVIGVDDSPMGVGRVVKEVKAAVRAANGACASREGLVDAARRVDCSRFDLEL